MYRPVADQYLRIDRLYALEDSIYSLYYEHLMILYHLLLVWHQKRPLLRFQDHDSLHNFMSEGIAFSPHFFHFSV